MQKEVRRAIPMSSRGGDIGVLHIMHFLLAQQSAEGQEQISLDLSSLAPLNGLQAVC